MHLWKGLRDLLIFNKESLFLVGEEMLPKLTAILPRTSFLTKKQLFLSGTGVALVRSSLTQSRSHWVTLSLSLYLPVLCRSRCQTLTVPAAEKREITKWMRRWNARYSTQSAHLHLAKDAGRFRQAAGWLSTQIPQWQRSRTRQTVEEFGCRSWRWVIADRVSSKITLEHKQTGARRQERPEEQELWEES